MPKLSPLYSTIAQSTTHLFNDRLKKTEKNCTQYWLMLVVKKRDIVITAIRGEFPLFLDTLDCNRNIAALSC